jgi:hypothetical protein
MNIQSYRNGSIFANKETAKSGMLSISGTVADGSIFLGRYVSDSTFSSGGNKSFTRR